jgi:hypothetical protein
LGKLLLMFFAGLEIDLARFRQATTSATPVPASCGVPRTVAEAIPEETLFIARPQRS